MDKQKMRGVNEIEVILPMIGNLGVYLTSAKVRNCGLFYKLEFDYLYFYNSSLIFVGSGKRGLNKHKALKKAFKQNGNKLLEINFDFGDLKTVKPVGKYAAHLSSYIGELVRDIPQYYKSWDKVPAAEKAKIIPNLQVLFILFIFLLLSNV